MQKAIAIVKEFGPKVKVEFPRYRCLTCQKYFQLKAYNKVSLVTSMVIYVCIYVWYISIAFPNQHNFATHLKNDQRRGSGSLSRWFKRGTLGVTTKQRLSRCVTIWFQQRLLISFQYINVMYAQVSNKSHDLTFGGLRRLLAAQVAVNLFRRHTVLPAQTSRLVWSATTQNNTLARRR